MKKFASLFIIAAAVCWGVIGLSTRSLSEAGLSSFQICAVRCILAGAGLSAVLGIGSPKTLCIDWRDLWMFFGTGVCSIVFFNVCYFSTMKQTTLSAAAILLYTAPVFVMLMSAIFFRESITVRKVIALCLALGGCVLVTGVLSGQSGITPLGFLTGLGAGFGYALYSIFGRAALAKYGSLTVTTYTFIVAGICVLPFCRPAEIIRCTASPSAVGSVLFLALVSTVIPYLLYTAGLRYTEAGKASVMASVEPVVASVVGILAFRESMTFSAVAGSVLVLASVVLLNLPAGKEKADNGSASHQ